MSGVALVTGAGSGVGRAVSMALCAAGWRVALLGRHAESLDHTAELAGGATLPIVADVTSEDDVARAFARIEAEFGRLDLLFNNAGMIGPVGPIESISLADWRATVDVNLTGSWMCARAAMALMKRQDPRGGRIINNGSLSAHTPRPETASYVATKHAISGLTKALSLEGRAHDIACGQIDIGNAATDMTSSSAVGMRQPNGEFITEPTMDVKHVATLVVQMASLPLDANVASLMIMATTMPFSGRG